MISANVEFGIKMHNGKIKWHKGCNSITDYGVERMRDAIIGSGDALTGGLQRQGSTIFDPHMQFRTDGNVLSRVDDGFPTEANSDDIRNLQLSTTYQGTETISANLSFTNLQMYDARAASKGALLQIARTSLNPVPPSNIANGTTIIVRWTIAANVGVSLTNEAPGSGATQRYADGIVEIINRIIGEETASNTGMIQFWQSKTGSTLARNADKLSTVNITLSEDPANDKRLISSAFSYPAIAGSSSRYRYHWAEIYLGRGSSAKVVRLFYEDRSGIARPSATPNQSTDLIFSSA